ncbi:MAG: hypothetical protein KIT09_25515 [Bryobacteraceae bacterium]|nr:hypothetical protein [Bryobacteraceae bacterium]
MSTLLAGAVVAPGQETASPAPPPLPEGDVGIAAKYPGDAGIERAPAVLLHDSFEEWEAPADLHKKWTVVAHEGNMRIAAETANVHHGKRALEVAIPRQQEGLSVELRRAIENEQDVVFLRFYAKFEKEYDHARGSSHNGGLIAAHYFPGGRATPGIPADGRNKFLVNFETERGDHRSPGPLNIYVYYPEQGGIYGDHIYPTGKVVASVMRSPAPPPVSFGPHFVPRPDFIPELDRWYCYEYMVKANTPGQRDGRVALWVDGKLIADFPNFRLRDVESLKIDMIGIGLYLRPNTIRENRKWFDDVVAATSYIGPIYEPK